MKTAIHLLTWAGYAGQQKMPFDLEASLREIREAGYDGVEAGGGEPLLGTPAEFLKKVQSAGLEIAAYGASVSYNPWPPNTAEYQADMRYAEALGVKTMMVCGGFNYFARRNQYAADYDLFGKNLGAALSFARKFGLEIAYHPHRGCIVETGDETALLLKRIPSLKLCVDIAHLEACGDDAVKFIRRFGKKIIHTHIKDYDVKKNVFTELGKGRSNLKVDACLRELKKAGYSGWICVELDQTFRTPLESARISRRYLAKLGSP
jgi:inosose dehydratase